MSLSADMRKSAVHRTTGYVRKWADRAERLEKASEVALRVLVTASCDAANSVGSEGAESVFLSEAADQFRAALDEVG